ncbi:MAG: exo-alpha-sialidase [Planctomycetes bacterium]|nr:exo-alpha-sialidase [Planctomycetota bacterium]
MLWLLPGTELLADRALGDGDAQIHARLELGGDPRGAAALRLGDGVFGWDGAAGRPFVEGGPFGPLTLLDLPGSQPLLGRPFDVDVSRHGDALVVALDGVTLHESSFAGPLGRVGLRAQRSELGVGALSLRGALGTVRAPVAERLRVPTLDADLSGSLTIERSRGPHTHVFGNPASTALRLFVDTVAVEVVEEPGSQGTRTSLVGVRDVVGSPARRVPIVLPDDLSGAVPDRVALARPFFDGTWPEFSDTYTHPIVLGFASDRARRTNGLLLAASVTSKVPSDELRWEAHELPASLAGREHALAGDIWQATCCDRLVLAFVDGFPGSSSAGDLVLALASPDELARGGDALVRVRLLVDPVPGPDGLELRLEEQLDPGRVTGPGPGRPPCSDCRVSLVATLDGGPGRPPEDVTFTLRLDELVARGEAFDAELPLVDLAHDDARRVVVDREPGQYLGHPTTLLLPDGHTLLCVYPQGHGRGALVMKRSDDGGLTWSERLPLPESFATSQEVPTIHRLVDRDGTARLVLFSGLFPIRRALSLDEGRTWSELEPVGAWGGIVAMASVAPLRDGRSLALFHDDGRFASAHGVPSRFSVYATTSDDGGVTWSAPRVIASDPSAQLCEPGLVRSPDGARLAVLLRENSRAYHAFVIFSDDEGETWTAPRELPAALTGDRHVAAYAPDGRLLISFRDTLPGSPTWGDWVAWIGEFDDLVRGTAGAYRVRLGDNLVQADCGYAGVEVLPDGTFVATTYGHWTEGESPYVVSVRFTMSELDARLAAQRHR